MPRVSRLSPFPGTAPPRSAGVSWQEPPGMQVADASIHNCPGRCAVSEGVRTNATNSFPLIRVHEPLSGSGASALTTLTTWLREDRGEVLRVLQGGTERVGGSRSRWPRSPAPTVPRLTTPTPPRSSCWNRAA